MLSALLPGMAHLQNIHPIGVHFPIAFLIAMAFIYLASYIFRREQWSRMAFWLLVLGTISAAVAVATGLYAQGGVMVAPSVRAQLLHAHKQLMLITLGLSVVATVWAGLTGGFPKKGRLLFVIFCLLIVAVLTKGADFGGRMVFDYNAGGYACSQPIEFSK